MIMLPAFIPDAVAVSTEGWSVTDESKHRHILPSSIDFTISFIKVFNLCIISCLTGLCKDSDI